MEKFFDKQFVFAFFIYFFCSDFVLIAAIQDKIIPNPPVLTSGPKGVKFNAFFNYGGNNVGKKTRAWTCAKNIFRANHV